jgi:hypothetical protein
VTPRTRFDAMQWRRDDGIVAVRLRDGTVRGYPDFGLSESFARAITHAEYHWSRRALVLSTDETRIALELGTARNPSPLRGRPVVYLDQNHMSTLSKALRAPQRLTDRQWWAAIRLITLAVEGKIVVPFSSAHMSETAAWADDAARFHLATTILSVSRGWQLRDSLQVRQEELVSLLSSSVGRSGSVDAVITLAPYAALASRVSPGKSGGHLIDETPALLHIYRSTLWLNVVVSILLDETPMPKGSVSGWTVRVQEFSDWVRDEAGRTKRQRHRSAAAFMFADEGTEVARAALAARLTPEEMSRWSRQAWLDADRGQPAVSIFRSVMIDKLLTGHEWEDNDLTDFMYLSTAVGYCDFVAGDRRAIALLRQTTRRLGFGAELHGDLPSLVESLDASLA